MRLGRRVEHPLNHSIAAALGLLLAVLVISSLGDHKVNSNTNSPHPLNGAFARLSRAEEHLADLVRKLALRGQEQVNAIRTEPNPQDPKKLIVQRPELPLDLSFSVLVGEIVYNLRSTLDYLIFELAALDSGVIIDGTQFPIEDRKKGFKWRVNGGWLKGLNAAHIAAIEALQPYRGGNWTAILRDLSNPDKHRTLVPTQAEHELTIHVVDRDHIADFSDLPGAVRSAITSDGTEVYVKAVLTSTIQFTDGTPVIETLEKIKTEVAATLEAFKPEFE
jgi:hypothetical protein